MIKKLVWLLSIVGVLSFSSCGGGSSDEAKELLQKILQFVGIPHNIVANICQDANRDGICGGGELFTKVTINKGDSIDDIWKKISLTKDGQYFLETYNPELPILVELQDVSKVNFDDGKFTLAFDGFTTKEDDNEIKEVSILESMVDANALSKAEADKFRTLTNPEAQDKYYTALLESLEININTLRSNGLDRTTAISATIKEMADETKTNQEQADRINSCGNNQACVDEEIKKIKDELIITEDEVLEIIDKKKSTPTPTPTTTPTSIKGEEVQYGKWIKPSQSSCENDGGKYEYNDCSANWENANSICQSIGGELPNIETLGAVVTDCGGDLVSRYTNDTNNQYERVDKNRANDSYQSCFQEKGLSYSVCWSSTTTVSDSSYAWTVDFHGGYDNEFRKTRKLDIRCVRER